MRKTIMISFRTSQELKESLDRIVCASNNSRSSIIEMIMRDFLSRNQEKGTHAPTGNGRMEFSVTKEEVSGSEKNVYLLLGGIRVGLPKNLQSKISLDEKTGIYQIEFSALEEENNYSAEGPRRGTKSEIEFRDQTIMKEDALHAESA